MAQRFERTVCTRCGGCGEFSYCQMYGKTCFKCHGKGEVLTERGNAAMQWMQARMTVRADEVKVGQRVNIPGYGKFNVKFAGYAESEAMWLDKTTGQWMPYFELKGEKLGYSTFPEEKVQLVLPAAEHNALLAEALAFQETLTQAGTVRKQRKTA